MSAARPTTMDPTELARPDVRRLPAYNAGLSSAAVGRCYGIEGIGIAPECILVGNGSENLLELLCLAFLRPGDRVVTQTPSFGLHVIYP